MNHEIANSLLDVALSNELAGFDQKLKVWQEMNLLNPSGFLVDIINSKLPDGASKPGSITADKAIDFIDKSGLDIQQDFVTMMLYAINFRFIWGREVPAWVTKLEENIQNPNFVVEGGQAFYLRQLWLEILRSGLFNEDYF